MTGFQLKIPESREFTGGDLLAQCLQQLGVTDAFGLHGGHLDAFLMGCEFIGIRLIDTRHESVAVRAAEGYAKVSGKLGACFVTANSGFSNGLPGLATALADRSPIFCITSSPPLRDAENNSLQGSIDQVVTAKPLTKFAHRVTHAEDIPRLVSLAVRNATAAPQGPALIDFPIDVLFSPVHQSRISWGSLTSPLPYPPGPHMDAIRDALAVLKEAKRPAIIVGSGARSAETALALPKFIGAANIPLFNSGRYSAALPQTHPLNGGRASNLAFLPAIGSSQPDVILLLGARTGMFLGGRSGAVIPKEGCKIIQVDTDGSEIGRTLPVDVGIVSDVGQTLVALSAALETSIRASDDWVKSATSVKSLPPPHEQEPKEMSPGRLHPHHALAELFKSLKPGSIVCTDGGESGLWSGQTAPLCDPHLVISTTGYLGFLGNGFGYALGCAVAAPDRQIINIQGDGSAGLHFMDLDTYARFKLNILTVVVNNYCWGMSSNGQELIYGSKTALRPASALSPVTAYEQVAQGLGNESARIDKLDGMKETVGKLSAVQGPSCINLIVSDQPTHPGTTMMVGKTDDPDMIVVPYYDNIPRPYYKS